MYRSSPEGDCIALRFGLFFWLPFELGSCLAGEILARIAEAIDRSLPFGPQRSPSRGELSAVDPLSAFCLAVSPFVPGFKRSICEDARSGRDSRWSAYDLHSKAAAEVALETDWPKVAKALGRWLKLQLTLLRKVEYRRRGAQLWALTRSFIGRRVFKSLRHADQDQLSTLLTDVRRDCDTAKALFQIGSFDEAVTRYAAILEMMGKVDSRITEPSALSAPSPEPQIAELRAERVRVLVNVALCQKKLCRLAESGAAATEALAMEPDHAK
ncbi:unnamed protein product, partial [Polarella glacialis]